MTRALYALVLSLVFALAVAPQAHADAGSVGVALAVLVLASLALVAASRDALTTLAPAVTGRPAGDERCLHGSFRHQSSPDAPGRPRPRAPGAGHRPA